MSINCSLKNNVQWSPKNSTFTSKLKMIFHATFHGSIRNSAKTAAILPQNYGKFLRIPAKYLRPSPDALVHALSFS